jgi:glycine hydroxymethyltransferase
MANVDPKLRRLLREELRRQQTTLSFIASENIVSPEILSMTASVSTNKYSEGVPGRRYYAGNTIIDEIETLAIERAKKLFGADHANVQPHAGAIANLAVFSAFLQPGDTILALDLASGGHLTMGHPKNISGKWFSIIPYGLDARGYIDMKQVRSLARQHRPKMIISGASAYSRTIDFAAFGTIAKRIGALHLADISHIAGLVAAKVHPSPVPHADVVTMTTHKTLRGPRGAMILCREKYAAMIDSAVMPGVQGGPFDHIIAAKAQSLHEAAQPSFIRYQRQVLANAQTLATELQRYGLTICSGGTDTHLLLVDVTPLGIRGAEAERRLEAVGIVVNKNVIPNDPHAPANPSGIRLGTPSCTTRGMKQRDIRAVAALMIAAIQTTAPREQVALRKQVQRLAASFPIYESRVW